jgi:hypothetical protein
MREDEKTAKSEISRDTAAYRTVFEKHQGSIIKMTGDGILATFPTPSQAVEACLEARRIETHFKFRTGISLGEASFAGGDLYGDAVNIAYRLESIAEPGSIYTSDTVRNTVAAQSFEKPVLVGNRKIKGIDFKFPVYAWLGPHIVPKPRAKWHHWAIAGIVTMVIAAASFYPSTTNRDSSKLYPLRKTVETLKGQSESGEEAAEIDKLMDEAFLEVLQELEQFETLRQEAKKSLDASLVLTWLASSPFGKTERGKLESQKWEMIKVGIEIAKSRNPAINSPAEVVSELNKQSDPAVHVAREIIKEEFSKE